MTRAKLGWLAWAWLMAAANGCVKTHESPELGTNTNWLKPCTADSECRSGTSCLCGVCTLACESDVACGAVNASTQCKELSTYACGSAATASACVQGCSSNADCSATLEHGQCVDGLCIPAPVPPDPSSATGFELSRRDMEIVLTSAYTECSSHEECELVSTSCSCCELGAIQTSLQSTYRENSRAACLDYQGPICDCDYLDLVARCDEGRCRTVPRPAESCFSPWQSPERSLEAGALGCRCSARREAVACAGASSFSCTQENGPIFAWSRADTSACDAALADPDCASGERLSGQQCVVKFSLCYALPSGEFCGK